jgi:hypothetical protein
MDNSFTYHEPLSPAPKPKTDDGSWDKVLEAHKNKDFKGVVKGILDYVDLDLAQRTGNPQQDQFEIPHGSVYLQLKITDDRFEVEAPFVNIEASKQIPLMRKVTELNFSPLNLSSIVLHENLLTFRYQCPLSLCEPYRTYEALREICIYADSYDDEFISKFGAQWIREPKIEPYPEPLKQTARANMALYIEEARTGVNFFETKRAFNLAWDVIVITLMKIEFYIQPQGSLRTEIEKMVSYLTGSTDPMNDKVSRGKTYLDKLSKYDPAEFDKDLYVSSTFIPYKVRSNTQTVRTNSENAFAQSKVEIDQKNHLGASMTLLYYFFNMFYHNTVPDEVYHTVQKALVASSAKPWPEVSGILYQALSQIMSGDMSSKENRPGGFFKKLFGNKDS